MLRFCAQVSLPIVRGFIKRIESRAIGTNVRPDPTGLYYPTQLNDPIRLAVSLTTRSNYTHSHAHTKCISLRLLIYEYVFYIIYEYDTHLVYLYSISVVYQ